MRIISEKRFREFWKIHPMAMNPLKAWAQDVKAEKWANFADIRSRYPKTDKVGELYVFNIGGNKFRLIVRINFKRSIIYMRHVLTHDQYDVGSWKTS